MAATIPFSAALFYRGPGNPKIRSRCLLGPATELRCVSKRAFSLRDDSFLPSDIARDFQFCLNGKNMKAIGEIWSDDCLVEDFSFSKPLRGKQEVMGYWGMWADAMGDNVNMVTEDVYGGEEITAAVWHLEWKDRKIPFTRGCSIYHLHQEPGKKPLIRRALMAVEWPLKPGALSLELLKIIAFIFNSFPHLAGTTLGFTQKSEVISQLLMHIWRNWVNPLIFSLLVSYTGIWAHALKVFHRLVLILLETLKKLM